MAAAAVVLSGCSADTQRTPSGSPPQPDISSAPPAGTVSPAGTPVALMERLTSPWSVVRLNFGSAFISERDTARVVELTSEGSQRIVGTVPGVDHGGEGGLLGLAVVEDSDSVILYTYFTSATDNRIVRMQLRSEASGYRLGQAEPILTGLAKARNHNGGRIAIGPDNKLYATVGDAGQPDRAQDMASLNGKILRMNLDGSVPSDNPFPSSLVYTLGHRNPQGITWDADGELWASEFGQNTWDEFNHIEAGKNYGWPLVEGKEGKTGFVDPVMQWSTADASPSGLAFVSGTFFMASLRGQRLWAIYPGTNSEATPEATAWFTGDYGRLRDTVPGPDGTLWMLTNNTDGRGSPQKGDDKLLQITLVPLAEG